MSIPYTSPSHGLPAFNCPHCGAFAKQHWFYGMKSLKKYSTPEYVTLAAVHMINAFTFTECENCKKHTFWLNTQMVYPLTGTTQLPNIDMPEDVKTDYEEARRIVELSPRGAAALLRLAIQKLCKYLGGSGKNINTDIGRLVKKGLPSKIQKALDTVRVIGNNAVHPGLIDIKDDIETANILFTLVNIICENQISEPKLIDKVYKEKVPAKQKEEISERDK